MVPYRGCSQGIKVGIRMLSVLLLVQGANAIIITVDDSGGMDYIRIQDAIDNASEGDTILVANGTYFEQITITRNNLRIIGQERNSTIIRGNWSADRVVDVQASNVYFSGFTVTNSEWEGIGLFLHNTTNFTFINNTLKDNYYNVQMTNSNHNLMDSNNISPLTAFFEYYYYYQDVFYITSSSNNTFKGNTGESMIDLTNSSGNEFYNNSISNIQLNPDSNHNKFAGNKFGSLSISTYLDSFYSNENIIRNNEAQRLSIYKSNQNIIEGNNISSIGIYSSNNNIINNNTIMQSYDGGISLSNSSHNAIYGNNITNGSNGISLESNSKNNTISNNLIQSAGGYSIYIVWSSSNKVYLNTFNSAKNALGYNGFNSWDYGGKGNFWIDYSGQDNDSDGIGDTPYLKIDTNTGAKDNYPFMTPPCNCALLPIPSPSNDPAREPSPGNVTRSISPSWVHPNSSLNITLTPSPSGLFDTPGYQVVETIPRDFTVTVSPGMQIILEEGNYKFTQIGNSSITYTIRAPSANGNYTVNGTFIDENRNYGNVSGMTMIKVGTIDYDANNNGRIDKNEAIQAVLDYFSGDIAKQDAIDVVVAFFEGS